MEKKIIMMAALVKFSAIQMKIWSNLWWTYWGLSLRRMNQFYLVSFAKAIPIMYAFLMINIHIVRETNWYDEQYIAHN